MLTSLEPAELAAIKIAEQAVRVLPQVPCNHAFPLLQLLNMRTETMELNGEETKVISFKIEMRTGCFDTTNEDLTCWADLLFHLVCDDFGIKCTMAKVEYHPYEQHFVRALFTAEGDENGQIQITPIT